MTVDVFTNETNCVLTRSHITGDILCRWPGPNCDCLMQSVDESFRNHPVRGTANPDTDLRERLIADAENIQPGFREHVMSPGKYDGCEDKELCAALATIANGGDHDELYTDEHGVSAAAIDCYVLRGDEQGFLSFDQYDTAARAQEVVESMFMEVPT